MSEGYTGRTRRLLDRLGAIVTVVPNCSIANPENQARRAAEDLAAENGEEEEDVLFANQFENEANWKSHYETSGTKIWEDMTLRHRKKIVGFVMCAGTGGAERAEYVAVSIRYHRRGCWIGSNHEECARGVGGGCVG